MRFVIEYADLLVDSLEQIHSWAFMPGRVLGISGVTVREG